MSDINNTPDRRWTTAAELLEEPGSPAALEGAGHARPSGIVDERTLGLIADEVTEDDMKDIATLGEQLGIKPVKSRALSAAERAQQEAEARRIQLELDRQAIADEQELAAERDRYTEIDPQRKPVFLAALVIGLIIFATSALFSFPAVAHAAESMLPTWFWLTWIVPFFVEAFVIFFGVDAVIWQARAANVRYSKAQADVAQKSSANALKWMLVFAGVGVVANWYSTFQAWGGTLEVFTNFEAIFGMALAALAPLSVVLITKRLTRLVFIYAVRD